MRSHSRISVEDSSVIIVGIVIRSMYYCNNQIQVIITRVALQVYLRYHTIIILYDNKEIAVCVCTPFKNCGFNFKTGTLKK